MRTNLTQAPEKQKRYVVTVSFYHYADDDKSAVREATKFTNELNKSKDAKASIESITESKFGQFGAGRKIM